MHRLPLLLLLTALAACAPLHQPETGGQPLLSGEAPDSWHATGRFAFRGEQSRSGQFDWQQRGPHYSVRLFGTFGLGSVRIEGDDQWAEITRGEDSWFTDTPELTLYQITGVSLPVSELSNWMTGRATSHHDSLWSVSYSQIHAVESFQLPGRIELQSGETSLSILLSNWELPDA